MRKAFERLRRAARWSLHLAALSVLVSGLLWAGSAYAFCPNAQRVMVADACCGGKHAPDVLDVPSERTELKKPGCCEVRTMEGLPAVDISEPPSSPPPAASGCAARPLASAAPARPRPWVRAAPVPPRAAIPIRAGPRSAPERCALLQVYLR